MKPGDRIEFLSSDGNWKPGVVDKIMRRCGNEIHDHARVFNGAVRIYVGNGVHIIRPKERCRLVEPHVVTSRVEVTGGETVEDRLLSHAH